MNKVIITGGSKGIGACLVKSFVNAGCKVAFTYNSTDAQFEGAKGFKANFENPQETRASISSAIEYLGGVDVLVNNAGIAHFSLFNDIKEEDWQRVMDINLNSAYRCTQQVLPFMINQKCGRIINISSMWGVCGSSCEVAYSVSKAGLIGLTKALAKELGPSGITVNCIAPGLIDTDMNKCLDSATVKELEESTPIGRIGKAEDIAGAAMYFASKEASFVTGQVLGIDGGFI